jgi:hypothetical protein
MGAVQAGADKPDRRSAKSDASPSAALVEGSPHGAAGMEISGHIISFEKTALD